MKSFKKLGSYIVSSEDGLKLLKMSKEDCHILLEWFQFMGKGDPTVEDIQFHTKIKAASAIMQKQKDYEFVVVTPWEAHLAHQWYLDHCPKALADRGDMRIDAILTAFEEKYGA